MYGETFYGGHTAQHQLQWMQIKIRNEKPISFHMIYYTPGMRSMPGGI